MRSHLKARTQRRKRLNVRRIYYNLQMERDPGAFSCSMLLLCPTDGLHITAQIPLPPTTANPFPPIKPSVPLARVFDESPLQTDCYSPVRDACVTDSFKPLYISLIRHCTCHAAVRTSSARCVTDRLQQQQHRETDTNAEEITSYLSVSLRSLGYVRLHFIKRFFFVSPMPQRDVPIDDYERS